MAIDEVTQFVAVFCGSSIGDKPIYAEAAIELGQLMGINKLGLVFGGGKVGLMGTLADAVMSTQGEVYGYIPHFLSHKEVEHEKITQITRVDTMHERKALMADHANAFIAMPGGFGTYDELFEIITWAQLKLHEKPIGILNVDGFYDGLLQFIERATQDGFIKKEHHDLIVVDADPKMLLKKMKLI